MAGPSLTAQVQAILRHDGPIDIFVIGLAAWHAHPTATEFHYLYNNLRDLAAGLECDCFKLPSHDLVIASEASSDAVRSGLAALVAAFVEEHEVADGFQLPVDFFSLPDDWEALRQRLRLAAMTQLRNGGRAGQSDLPAHNPDRAADPASRTAPKASAAAQGRKPGGNTKTAARPALPTTLKSAAKASGPLTINALAEIAAELDRINFANFIERQSCFRMNKNWQTLFVEHYSNLQTLQQKLFANIELNRDDPLFFELCRHLDRMMLITILIDRPAKTKKIAINLTNGIASTKEFQQFDRGLSAAERNNTIVEIHWIDALRDLNSGGGMMASFAGRGFPITLDRVSIDMLPVIAAADLKFDHLKIIYERSKLACLTEPKFAKALTQLERDKLILIGCDDETAFKFGQALGITAYQGWLITELAQSQMQLGNAGPTKWQTKLKSRTRKLPKRKTA